MSSRSYYELLNIPKDATKAQIKQAYKEIARIYHPDSNFYDEILDDVLTPEQDTLFQEITNAYNTLLDDDRRREYDDTLPPDLAGWDAGEGGGEKGPKTPAHAFGTFGAVRKGPPPENPKYDPTGTVSEMIKFRRSPWGRLRLFIRDLFGR